MRRSRKFRDYTHNFSAIQRRIDRDLEYLLDRYDLEPLIVLELGSMNQFPASRDFAFSEISEEPFVITISPCLLIQPISRIIAVMRHEIAHCVLADSPDHSEQDADDLVEELFGHKIYYDDELVQTVLPAQYPRPLEIHQ